MKRVLLALLCALTACLRSAPPAHSPLGVLKFDNLTGDPALDWMGRGAARAVAAQIEGAVVVDSSYLAEERQRAIAGGSTRILHGYIALAAGRLRLHAGVEDAAAGKFLRSAEATGAPSAGLPPLADTIAHQLDPQAGPALTKSNSALEAFVAALNAPNPDAAIQSLSGAIAADPNFATPYLTLIEIYTARQDRASAGRVLAMARSHAAAFSPADRARMDAVTAQISGDSAALGKSLAALARLTPNDPRLLRSLGDAELQARRYSAAVTYYQKAVGAQPGDVILLNTLGYAQAYAGDIDGAIKTLREYERVRPAEANPLDSMGDVCFYGSRFAEAEQFYRDEYRKDPTFLNGGSLIKAATAHLFTGDANGAEAVFSEYEQVRRAANDPLVDLTRASWDHLRGNRNAIGALEKFASTSKARELTSLAHSTLTIWLLEAGDRARAQQHAAQAVATAAGPGTSGLAGACRYIANPTGEGPANPLARAYALLLANDFGQALPLLRQIQAHPTPGPSEPSSVLLAWALVETGHADEAAQYVRANPVPVVPGPQPFESLLYPRIFHLRAVVAEKKGDTALAARNNRLFQTLSSQK